MDFNRDSRVRSKFCNGVQGEAHVAQVNTRLEKEFVQRRDSPVIEERLVPQEREAGWRMYCVRA
jgi:hypothetical protein